MTHYVIDKPPRIAAPIKNTDALFPVRRIYCIGRNYADHAIEMGHDPDREPPFFFQKNPDNLDFSGTFTYPEKSLDVHYEIELVIAISKGTRGAYPTWSLSVLTTATSRAVSALALRQLHLK